MPVVYIESVGINACILGKHGRSQFVHGSNFPAIRGITVVSVVGLYIREAGR